MKVSNHAFEHYAARAEKIARCVSLAQWSSCHGHVCDTASMVPLRAWWRAVGPHTTRPLHKQHLWWFAFWHRCFGPPQLLRAAAAGCCGLLRAAAGSAAGAATSVFCFPGLVGCVRCRNWLGGMRFSSLLVFTTTSTLLLFLLLLNLLFQVRNSFTNAQERSIPTYSGAAKLPPQHCKMPSEPFGRTLHVPVGRPY